MGRTQKPASIYRIGKAVLAEGCPELFQLHFQVAFCLCDWEGYLKSRLHRFSFIEAHAFR